MRLVQDEGKSGRALCITASLLLVVWASIQQHWHHLGVVKNADTWAPSQPYIRISILTRFLGDANGRRSLGSATLTNFFSRQKSYGKLLKTFKPESCMIQYMQYVKKITLSAKWKIDYRKTKNCLESCFRIQERNIKGSNRVWIVPGNGNWLVGGGGRVNDF